MAVTIDKCMVRVRVGYAHVDDIKATIIDGGNNG